MNGIELTPDQSVDSIGRLATRAENAGFDTIFSSCHYNNRDPFLTLSRIAETTETVHLGPGVANPYDVHPVRLATQTATLDEISGGRAVMGIGAGDASTLSNLGVERDRPLGRVLESLQVARRLWAGERVDHDGTFRVRNAGLNFRPPGTIPVYVGAQGPHMLRMAGKYADGVLVNGSHPADLAWASNRVEEGIDDRPDTLDSTEFETVAFASVSVAEDAEAARTMARRPVSFIVAGAAPPVLDRHDLDEERAAEIGDAIGAGDFSRADSLVTRSMLDSFAVAGDRRAVRERFEALLDHADGVVVAAPLGPDKETAIGLAGAALDSARE